MTEPIKICPKCGHANPQHEIACTVCAYLISREIPVSASAAQVGLATAPPRAASTPKLPAADAPAPLAQDDAAIPDSPSHAAPVRRRFAARPSLYLQASGTERVFEVGDGWIAGQAHPTSTAQLQLRDLPSVTYVHQQHCQFTLREATWHVTALDQAAHGHDLTNPTLVNQIKLAPGDTHALRNGDQLSLAGVKLAVRIL